MHLMYVFYKVSVSCMGFYQPLVRFLISWFGLNSKTVEKCLHCHDALSHLLIQALHMYLQTPFVPRCVYKYPRALEFCHTRYHTLRWLLNSDTNPAFFMYTLN